MTPFDPAIHFKKSCVEFISCYKPGLYCLGDLTKMWFLIQFFLVVSTQKQDEILRPNKKTIWPIKIWYRLKLILIRIKWNRSKKLEHMALPHVTHACFCIHVPRMYLLRIIMKYLTQRHAKKSRGNICLDIEART